MTMTLDPNSNGRVQRKNLSSQLDRLDSILDGLDQALTGAITDAVKEAVSTAVAEAVRATLIEVVTNPDVLALLRGGVPQPAQESAAAPASQATMLGRVKSGISSAWKWSLSKVKATGQAVISRTRKIRDGIVSAYHGVNAIWRLKRPLLIALGVGSVFGIIGYASSPWLAGVLSGIGAMGTTLGAQIALWTRRLFAGFAFR